MTKIDPARLKRLLANLRRVAVAPLTPVVGLLLGRRPTAVLGGVAPFVVDPIEASPGRLIAHIRKELLEGSPLITDGDSPATVLRPVLAPGISCPINHVRPRSVGARDLSSARVPVSCVVRHAHVLGVTSARLRVATSEIACPNEGFPSANATTPPVSVGLVSRTLALLNNRQPSVRFTDHRGVLVV